MKYYLAARYSRCNELRGYAHDLSTIFGQDVTSRWLEGGHEITKEGSTQADRESRAEFAQEDWDDLMAADVVVSFTEEPRTTKTRGGRHVEFGAALAAAKKCIVVGPRENVFHCLPQVQVFATWQELIEFMSNPIERGLNHADRAGD